jgi:hypothetical protein
LGIRQEHLLLYFLIFIVVGIAQIWLGYIGIEWHLGELWAIGALAIAFIFRLTIPITIGTYFGAVDVMGWDWYVGLIIAAPGLLFILPSMVVAALEPIFSNTKERTAHIQNTPTPNVPSPPITSSAAAPKGIHPRKIIEYRDYKILGLINGNFRVEEEYFKTEEEARQFIDNFYFDRTKFGSYEAASTRIEYDNHAEATWRKVQKVQSELGVEFLKRLDADPTLDIDALFSELVADYEKSQNPYDVPEANTALNVAATISKDAKEEFQKVYELLGATLSPDQILEKIKSKFVIQEIEVPAEPRLYRFPDDWEKRLQRAEQRGSETGMLLILEELGYSIDPIEKHVSRPELLETSEKGVFYYQTAHQLMTICNSERKFLGKVELGQL